MTSVKGFIVNALAGMGGVTFLPSLMAGRATVFMLHRFDCPEAGVRGHNLGFLRQALGYLRRNNYELISLRELYGRVAHDARSIRRAVAFTIDDGYFDHAHVASPIFAEFDCPVTTFVTTGFLDQQFWFWWDQIEFVFESARRPAISVDMGDKTLQYQMNGPGKGAEGIADFTDYCKRLKTEERHQAIARLAEAAEVEVPRKPPARYAPMTWEALRAAEQQGMEFGPHTVTHPILSQTSDEQSACEVTQSWEKLRREAKNPVPVFCYPNGRFMDFSEREIRVVRQAELCGAVSGEPGYFDRGKIMKDADERFCARRFAFPDNMADLIQYVSGIERAKQLLRRET